MYETSSMCSEVMRTANTFLPLCLGCHRPNPSACIIYLSASKLQWTLSGPAKSEAGIFGVPASRSRPIFVPLGYCFGLLCSLPPPPPPEFIPWQRASGLVGPLTHPPMALLVKTRGEVPYQFPGRCGVVALCARAELLIDDPRNQAHL